MTKKIWPILKILMSVLLVAAGILEWMMFEEANSSLEMHHGVTIMGIVLLIDGTEKLFTLSEVKKTIKTLLG